MNDRVMMETSILSVANTYLEHADQLVYGRRMRTFLRGYELYENGKGLIDCSTLVLLCMAGIPFDESPYATGVPGAFTPRADLLYAADIARHFCDRKQTYEDPQLRRSGDLVFYLAKGNDRILFLRHGRFRAISHVGIIAEDTDYLIHSAPGEPTVRRELLKTREKPALFARCSLLPQAFLY